MNDVSARWSPERFAVASVVLLTLAPVVLTGIWRPLARSLQVEVEPARLAAAALAVTATLVVARGRSSRRWFPGLLGGLAAVASGLFLAGEPVAMLGVTASLLGVAVFGAALQPWLLRRLPEALDGLAARRRGVAALMLVLGLAAVVQTTRLCVFMVDASQTALSVVPAVPFLVEHSCLTAYVEGARLAETGVENLYDASHWPDLGGSAAAEGGASRYAPFRLDAFAYPPPFLLLPRFLLGGLEGYATQRAVWFALNALSLAAGWWIVSRWLGGRPGLRALLLAPVLWLSPPTLVALQVGNAHLAVTVAAMLSLVAFESRRPALGGALLSFAILAKVAPGLLVVVLLARRRYREVLWTGAFCVGFSLLALLVFGPEPFVAFVTYELPRLGTGEALGFLAGADSVPINLAPFGLAFKLTYLGLDLGDEWAIGRVLTLAYTAAILVLTVVCARKDGGRVSTAILWGAVLTLASLRSPLAPGYVLIPLLWTLAIRSGDLHGRRAALKMALLWAVLAVVPTLDLHRVALYTLLQQGVALGAAVWLVLGAAGGGGRGARGSGHE